MQLAAAGGAHAANEELRPRTLVATVARRRNTRMPTLESDLLQQGFHLRETHISRVFLRQGDVYKVKKPVQLGFLDFSTLELRRNFCETEVLLNRRLTTDVYVGVVPITRPPQGPHAIDGSGPIVDWAVHMRRLADADAANVRLRAGTLRREHVRLLAELLVKFHAAARSDIETARFGEPSAIAANVRENFEQTRQDALAHLSAHELAALERWQLGFLERQRDLLQARVDGGFVRDGHGDLRLEHCYLDERGKIDIIDCIEFSQRFRYGDVIADLAFLAMDLTWHEAHGLSEALLSDYARFSADYDAYALVDFYQSYRAMVRGKVSCIVERDAGIAPAARVRAGAEARKYFLLAEACTRDPLQPPALIAIGGVIASGKSSLAEELALALECPVVDADHTRKHLAGVDRFAPLPDRPFEGHYSNEQTAAVYTELLRRAECVLQSGRAVVLDASFRSRLQRTAALELAHRLGVPFLFVECAAPVEVSRARLVERARTRAVSDGRLEIFDAFQQSFEPCDELPDAERTRVDTTRPIGENVSLVRERLAGAFARS
jgi:aminoglycoside phosphotransferase family enzyme/predicted kinase